jgi:hypothetical protein
MNIKGILFSTFITLVLCVVGCKDSKNKASQEQETNSETPVQPDFVERIDTLGAIVLYPNYSRVDLACGTMPSKQDTSVILMVAGSFTGEFLKEFKHSNIAGDHVSNGKRYKGFKCKRNTGAFVFYNGQWKFVYKDYSLALDEAAKQGGAGFGQEMIIHKSEIKPMKRPASNKNIFRALCEIDKRLCIVQSQKEVQFKDFVAILQQLGATEALYLDMGTGWNYGWYREKNGKVHQLFNKYTPYSTNWVTFYK